MIFLGILILAPLLLIVLAVAARLASEGGDTMPSEGTLERLLQGKQKGLFKRRSAPAAISRSHQFSEKPLGPRPVLDQRIFVKNHDLEL